MPAPLKLRTRPAHVREVLDHHAVHGWTATLTAYPIAPRTLQRWLTQRRLHGTGWPTQAEDDEWVATLEQRERTAARLRSYRTRSCYGARRLTVDATGTRRRIQALMRLGWRVADMADRGPWGTGDAVLEMLSRQRVTVVNADHIARIYNTLCMTVGPSTANQRRGVRNGWAPPLAWTNIDTDLAPDYGAVTPTRDATGKPIPQDPDDVDDAVVWRILHGEWRRSCTVAEKRAVVARYKGSLSDLERLTGWRVERYVERPETAA